MAGYAHRQFGPWYSVFLVVGLCVFGIGAWWVGRGGADFRVAAPMLGAGGILFFSASLIGYLDVRDDGDRLAVRFGPVPLLGTQILYEAVESVERARTTLLDGFGVHGLPGAWIVFNMWGFQAVRIRLRHRSGLWRARTVYVGTDEPERLIEFLRTKVGRPRAPAR